MKYTQTVTDVMTEALKIPSDRVSFNFMDVQAINWGWMKTLVSTLLRQS